MKSDVSLTTAVQFRQSDASSSVVSRVRPLRIGMIVGVLVTSKVGSVELIQLLSRLPSSVRRVVFDQDFNSPVDQLNLPVGLTIISFRGLCSFNHPVSNWQLPSSLTELDFGRESVFDQTIDRLTLVQPAGLRILRLSEALNQPLLKLRLPLTLTELDLNQWSLTGVRLPDSITSLHLGGSFMHSLDAAAAVRLPSSLGLTELIMSGLTIPFTTR
jgi:hypothetical protein